MTKDDRKERKRKRLQDTWDNTPAANPRYGAANDTGSYTAVFEGREAGGTEGQDSRGQDEVSFS